MSRRPDHATFIIGHDASGAADSFWLCPAGEFYAVCRAQQQRLRTSGRFARTDMMSMGDNVQTAIAEARRRAARKRLLDDMKEWA